MKRTLNVNKILIAVENSTYSERAAEYGFLLAKKMEAKVALVHVNDVPAPLPAISDPMLSNTQLLVPEIAQIQEEAGNNLLDRICGVYGKKMEVATFSRLGSPENEILAVADEWETDILILGIHGRSGLDHFLSGSVAESVVRKAKCAVMIIPMED